MYKSWYHTCGPLSGWALKKRRMLRNVSRPEAGFGVGIAPEARFGATRATRCVYYWGTQ
jgi:hypothetical protein